MPRIVSFAYTAAPLIHRAKTVTRRYWKDNYARTFKPGDMVLAYDRGPHRGGKHIADIQITEWPFVQSLAELPDEDYVAEGFAWLHEHPEAISEAGRRRFGTFSHEDYDVWRRSGGTVWVVRFRLDRVVEEAQLAHTPSV